VGAAAGVDNTTVDDKENEKEEGKKQEEMPANRDRNTINVGSCHRKREKVRHKRNRNISKNRHRPFDRMEKKLEMRHAPQRA